MLPNCDLRIPLKGSYFPRGLKARVMELGSFWSMFLYLVLQNLMRYFRLIIDLVETGNKLESNPSPHPTSTASTVGPQLRVAFFVVPRDMFYRRTGEVIHQ